MQQGKTTAAAKQGLASVGGQLQNPAWCANAAFLPSLHGATRPTPREPQPSPSAPPGHRLPLPALCHGPQAQQRGQPRGHWVLKSLRLPAPRGCSWLSLPMLKHEAISLNVAIWVALVPRGHSRPGEGWQGCASLWDTPKPGQPQSPALQPCQAWQTRCRRAKGCQTPVKITLSGCPSHFPKH